MVINTRKGEITTKYLVPLIILVIVLLILFWPNVALGKLITGNIDDALKVQDDFIKKSIGGGESAKTGDLDQTTNSKTLIDFSSEKNIDIKVLNAIAQIESSGNGFTNGFPTTRFECHIYNDKNRQCKEFFTGKENQVKCTPKSSKEPWSVTDSETNRVAFENAFKENENLAICSSSFGKFQTMGFNYKSLNYNDIATFYKTFETEKGQEEIFIKFLITKVPISCLQDKDWNCIAEKYNGGGQVKTYASKLEENFNKA